MLFFQFASTYCNILFDQHSPDSGGKKSLFQFGRVEWKAKKKKPLFFPVELLPVSLATP